jgi:hypothetical protein
LGAFFKENNVKCIKCGKEYSFSVMPSHVKRCKIEEIKEIKPEINEPVEVIPAEDLNIKAKEYTLDELLQMCIDNQDIEYAPSTIKRWKEERAKKELGIIE